MWAKDFVSNGNISNIAEEAHPLLINANLAALAYTPEPCGT